jgi:hypothetical protein
MNEAAKADRGDALACVCQEATIDAPATEVWAMVGDPALLSEWIPAVVACRREGDVRTLQIDGDGGGEVVERILRHSDADRMYEYELISGAIPVSLYRSLISVDGSDPSLVTWTAWVSAIAPERSAALAQAIVESYKAALDNLPLAMARARARPGSERFNG